MVSETKNVLCDVTSNVTQGTVLGPILLNIYLNNVFAVNTSADDTEIIFEKLDWDTLKILTAKHRAHIFD